ncbi:hypothetical protein [Legionella feeleii]|uniref:Uncharacterized protein n=1 Tax=Legionella feeleii TaxID=453 RepID=A0A378IXR5_9GAMM|nr:hypothetical protein [Legionella feeleii]STX39365.1 Uncharacterised protein [Legionella feeleii]
MNHFKRLQIFFWNIDPGYFRVKHAFKTVLAIVIALWFVRDETHFTKAMTGLACGMSMQGMIAKSFISRVVQVILFDLAFFTAFIMGLWVRDFPHLCPIVLVVLGFTVNYMRRFGLSDSVAPMKVWTLCFLAIVIPLQTKEWWTHIYGFIIGLVAGALTLLFVFPENYSKLFINNSNRLFKALARGMNACRRPILFPVPPRNIARLSFVRLRDMLHRLLDSNQTIVQGLAINEREKLIDGIMIQEYALIHAFNMMVDSYKTILVKNYQLSPSKRLALSSINRQFAALLTSLTMNKDYSVTAKTCRISMAKITEKLSQEPLTDPALVMVFLNLKLSFNLLHENILRLQRGENAD